MDTAQAEADVAALEARCAQLVASIHDLQVQWQGENATLTKRREWLLQNCPAPDYITDRPALLALSRLAFSNSVAYAKQRAWADSFHPYLSIQGSVSSADHSQMMPGLILSIPPDGDLTGLAQAIETLSTATSIEGVPRTLRIIEATLSEFGSYALAADEGKDWAVTFSPWGVSRTLMLASLDECLEYVRANHPRVNW